MLRELNSIAKGLLGLHGYPLSPLGGLGQPAHEIQTDCMKRTPSTNVDPSAAACQPAKQVHARPKFAW